MVINRENHYVHCVLGKIADGLSHAHHPLSFFFLLELIPNDQQSFPELYLLLLSYDVRKSSVWAW
jgi:hypothetical protein